MLDNSIIDSDNVAINKAIPMKSVDKFIFESKKDQKILSDHHMKNYMTKKCPRCNFIVKDSCILQRNGQLIHGYKTKHYCENCGQRIWYEEWI